MEGDGLLGIISRREIARQGGKFLVAGGSASAVNWLTRLVASWFVPFHTALIIGAAIGMSIGFILYRSWVFPTSRRSLHAQTGLFLLVNAVTACLVIGASLLIVKLISGAPMSIPVQESIAHAIGIGLGAGLNFLGHRLVTFGAHKPHMVQGQ
jgi:energy-coupling factor transport system substrate-specific component